MSSSSDTLLPGQPVSLPRGPSPLLGSGLYIRGDNVRASVVGVPQFNGSVSQTFYIHNAFLYLLTKLQTLFIERHANIGNLFLGTSCYLSH